MFWIAHAAAGLIVGKLTENYIPAILAALLVDVDHLVSDYKNGIISFKKGLFRSWKDFWEASTNPVDKYGGQRGFLHNFFVWATLSAILIVLFKDIGWAIALGYFSNLVLDLLDASDYYFFLPFKLNMKGPIKYLSKAEWIFTGVLLIVFFLI